MDPFTRYLPALEATMRATLTPDAAAPALLYGMLHYHMGWADADFRPLTLPTGKRLRPVCLLLACEAQGGHWQSALPAAAAVELLHNFTLIHDDIEDRDAVRRGRPTLWSLWGEAQAINAGDALFALAYQALQGLQARGVAPEVCLHALDRYTDGILRLTEGQCRDIGFEAAADVVEAEYLAMIHGKTATLIGLACELGGIVAGATAEHVAALRAFGEGLGLAFQMQDDLLGLWGDPEQTGKAVGADIRRHKKTLPLLHGSRENPALRALLLQPELDAAAVTEALTLLERGGSRAYTEALAARYHAEALRALEDSGGSGEAQAALQALAQKLLHRDR